MSSIGNVRIGPANATMNNGLVFKNVRHFINRECMWYQPPHSKPEWKLKHNNKWRYDVSQFKTRKDFQNKLKDEGFTNEGLSKRKMREIRRKQFFAFFEGFFDKYGNDHQKLQTSKL